MKSYLIIDNNEDQIISVNHVDNPIRSKMANSVRPLGNTYSELNIILHIDEYVKIRDFFGINNVEFFGKKIHELSLVNILENDQISLVKYYGSVIREIAMSHNFDSVDVEINSDYHEVYYDDLDDLKSLFKSWERERKINQLGI